LLKPGTFAFTASLGLLTALGPISTDMYLPSLPAIARLFAADTATTQLTLSAYLFSFAFGQLIYGPLSDAFGRKPVLIGGLGIYMIATALCAAAVSMDMLIATRMIQAIGIAAVSVTARAIIRDVFSGRKAAQTLSYMGSIMGLAPMVAPLFGSVLHEYFGWRANFIALLGFAVVALCLVHFGLPETAARRDGRLPSMSVITAKYRRVLSNTTFRIYAGIAGLSFAGLFAFISVSSFILQNQYGQTPTQFAYSFGISVIGYIIGTLIGARLAGRLGIDKTIIAGACLLCLGGLAMLLFTNMATAQGWQIVIPFFIYLIGVGLTMPQCMAGALEPFAEMAGTASSAHGCIQMTSGAAAGIIVAQSLGQTPLPLAVLMAASGILALATIVLAQYFRRTPKDNR